MIPKLISILMFVTIPLLLLGGEPGKSVYVFKAAIPDSIIGIQIQFEVKQVKVLYEGRSVSFYCLCADIINQNKEPERILIRYKCQGEAKEKEIEIGGCQQRIILVDKCMKKEDCSIDIKDFYSLLLLEYRQ